MFEHAFKDHAGDLRLHAVDQIVMVLRVERRPTTWRRGMGGRAADMEADRQISGLGGLEDRPVAFAPDRLDGARAELDLREMRVAGALLNLGNGSLRILRRDQDRRPKSFLLGGE